MLTEILSGESHNQVIVSAYIISKNGFNKTLSIPLKKERNLLR